MRTHLLSLVGAASVAALALSQQPHETPPTYAGASKDEVVGADVASYSAPGLHLETNVGSFKIKKGSEDLNHGTLDISFTGTVLVDELTGQATPGPGVKLDYAPKDMPKLVYHGKGHLRVTGQFGSILFFGQEMHALYQGTGVIQLFGEFDKNLETGFYWYGNDLKKNYWGTGGNTILPVSGGLGQAPHIQIEHVHGKG